MKNPILFSLIVVLIAIWFAGLSLAAQVEKLQFLKISPPDHRAVMKSPDGSLRVVGVGEVIDGAEVVEIADGRVVLEQSTAEGPETVIFRLDGQHQRIERIRKQGGKQPEYLAPAKTKVIGNGTR